MLICVIVILLFNISPTFLPYIIYIFASFFLNRFIRDTDYCSLIDFKTYELKGELETLSDSLSVRQTVQITDFVSTDNSKGITNFDFYLTKISGLWLIDIVLLRK